MEQHSTVKLMGYCYGNELWAEARSNTTLWRGYGLWTIMSILRLIGFPKENIKIILPNTTLVQIVSGGRVDIFTVKTGLTWQRLQMISFGYPMPASEFVIISKKDFTSSTVNFLFNIYDIPTMVTIFIGMVLLILFLTYFRGKQYALMSLILQCYAYTIGQSANNSKLLSSNASRVVVGIYCLTYSVLIYAFSGLIIAHMLVDKRTSQLDTLDDLFKDPFQRTIFAQNSYAAHNYIKQSALLKHRVKGVKYGNLEELKTILQGVLDNKLVIFATKDLFVEKLNFHEDQGIQALLHISPAVYQWYISWIFPKNKTSIHDRIIQGQAWVYDMGLINLYDDKVKQGLFENIAEDFVDHEHNMSCPHHPVDLRIKVKPLKNETSISETKDVSISMLHLRAAFYLLLGGVCFALIAFVFEFLHEGLNNK